MRRRDYLGMAFRNVRRQSLRSLLTVVALAISSAVLTAMLALGVGGQKVITEQFGSNDALTMMTVTPNQDAGSTAPFGTVQQVNENASKLTDETVAQLKGLSHVQLASARATIWEFKNFSVDTNSTQFVAQAVGIASDAYLPLAAGTPFASNDDAGKVILGAGYAKALGFENNPGALVGKTVHITTQAGYRGAGASLPGPGAGAAANKAFADQTTTIDATVAGVTTKGSEQNTLFVPLGWAHDIRTMRYYEGTTLKANDQIAENGYSTIQLKIDDMKDVESVGAAVAKLGYGQVSVLSQVKQFQQMTLVIWIVLGAVALIAVLAAALGVVNTMLMAVSEQRYEVGVWRACGARKRTIRGLFLSEAVILGFVGGLIGIGAGYGIGLAINHYAALFLKAQNFAVSDVAVLPIWLLAASLTVTVVFSLLAGMYPAMRAAKLDPSEVLSA